MDVVKESYVCQKEQQRNLVDLKYARMISGEQCAT